MIVEVPRMTDFQQKKEGVAMFEKTAKLLKENRVRHFVLRIRRWTIEVAETNSSMREGHRGMEKFKCSVGDRNGRGPG